MTPTHGRRGEAAKRRMAKASFGMRRVTLGELAMLRIKINGAIASLMARSRPDGGWDVVCSDSLVGEFRLRSGDVLHIWSEEAAEWLPASEMDLAELAVEESEKGI